MNSSLYQYALEWLPQLLIAARHTLYLMFWSFVLSFVGGMGLALIRLSNWRAGRIFADVYLTVFRGIPLLALLFFIYFGLTNVGFTLTATQSAITGLSLVNAAYVAEIFRAGVESVPAGQSEAARSIGLRHAGVGRYVIVPQMIPFITPPLVNQTIILIKETSLASLITAPELMLKSRELSGEFFMPLEIYVLVGVIYLAMILPLSALGRRLERSYA